ncbi:recombinase family protein [Streptomyces sp. NPDC059385]|uniref:recombinase family protein n=1 Tax=Streptomyces sp. NPDC059385 TaxID=3346817 RepID=UPI0036CE7302
MPIAPEYLHHVYAGPFDVLLYGRNSRDPKKKGRSVGDQLTNGRTICEKFGWPVVDEYKDVGLSASRHAKKDRGDFERLLDDIRAKRGRIVVAFEASRYYRDLEAYVRLRAACQEAGVLLCYNGTIYDLSKREDRKATAMDALQAEDEAEGIRDRNVRTVSLLAEAGAPFGRIPWGHTRTYDPDTGDLLGQERHPVRAAYVDTALRMVDEGKSLYAVCQWLRSEGEPAAKVSGTPWDTDDVKAMLINPAHAGLRVHRGKVVGKAAWDPIVDVDMWRRVRAKLTDPSRSRQNGGAEALHYLSRIALCGECGDHALLTAGKRNGDVQYLNCNTRHDTAIPEKRINAFVEESILRWLASPEAREALIPDRTAEEAATAEARALLGELEEELRQARTLAKSFNEQGRPKLSALSLSTLEQALEPQIEKQRELIEASTGVSPLLQKLVMAPDPAEIWDGVQGRPGLELDQRREATRAIVTVRLYKASRPGLRSLEPGRIRLSFIGTPGYIDRPVSLTEHAARERAKRSAPGGE